MQKKKTGIELDNNISAIHKTKKKKQKKKLEEGEKKLHLKLIRSTLIELADVDDKIRKNTNARKK